MKWFAQLSAVILIAATSLFIIDCYTMMSHPELSDTDIAEYSENDGNDMSFIFSNDVTHGDDCMRCHGPQQMEAINSYYGHYYDKSTYSSLNGAYNDDYYWDGTYRSNYYYSSPWWVDEYYTSSGPSRIIPAAGSGSYPTPDTVPRRQPHDSFSIPSSTARSAGSLSKNESDDTKNETKSYETKRRQPRETSGSTKKSSSKSKNKND
ncbi:hypothetical protein KAH55_05215 [bacterium]|nr:hypothetical protein [bacterium]